MANQSWKVVWDPESEYWPGALVTHEVAHRLMQRGLVALPVEQQLLKMAGCGGFAKNEYGAGWPLDGHVHARFCPLTMFCTPDYQAFHWAARLMPGPSLRDGFTLDGQIRLTPDTAQRTPHSIGMRADERRPFVDVRTLGAPDGSGGWNVGGMSEGRAPGEGYYGFSLYGAAPGLRVVWAALSLAKYG